MRKALGLAVVLMALGVTSLGCGSKFKLPTESLGGDIPPDGSYQMQATWTGMDGVIDILLTQGIASQLYVVFNQDPDGTRGFGTSTRGAVYSIARYRPTGTPPPIAGVTFPTLFNPIAICVGGDGAGSPGNRVYVLDRGDSLIAYTNPQTGIYGDTTGGHRKPVKQLQYHWRVREFRLLGGDTVSTFADTTMAWVNGVAADEEGRVYVSGLAIVQVPDPNIPQVTTRTFFWRIYRYIHGPATPGVDPPDRNLPGANWHRDPSWQVDEGNGLGTVIGPRGLFWNPLDDGLFVADHLKNVVQKLSVTQSSTGFYRIPGFDAPPDFDLLEPYDVTADLAGFSYIADTGNRRVLRCDSYGSFVQRVSIESDAFGDTLINPVAVTADDSLVFVCDARLGPGTRTGRVIRYKRRQ
jgi:hypothetical protein